MPAHSATFPWPSYYGHFDFFEQRMEAHSGVQQLEALGSGCYRLTRADGTVLQTFVCECYSFGTAEYLEATEKLGKLDAVVISSNWCGYTNELKAQCRQEEVGLFSIKDFMAALNRENFWTYLNEWEEKRLKRLGLL